ncbi:MAG: four-carbon acid sugar kinase family protein, partial [Candidatus Latescibacterota bacterium]
MSDLILSYYGDDFTGSTDVMEALSFAGLKTVLFLSPPKLEQIAKFKDVKAVGVAGCTRSMSPDDMERELTPVYEAFRKLKTPIVHYKTCSTFDSAPDV